MKKGKNYYDDDLYEDDYDYDDDEEYEEYEEEEKPKKNNKQNNKAKETNKNKNVNNNNNKTNQQNKSQNLQNQKKNNNLDLQKKESDKLSSLALSPSSSSSISSSLKSKEKEKEKEVQKEPDTKNISYINSLESYPKIDYNENIPKEEKPTINLVIIGHVDSGKSTIIGHILLLLGLITEKDFQKKLKFGQKTKDSIQYAFATDESTSERERGVTIEVGFKNFETKNKKVIALDAPGHQDFIPNMIAGTSAADYALLVIDSGINAFDAGFYSGGRTKEHALLAKTLGVSKIIVAVNKLELFNWEEKRYNEIVEVLQDYLTNELGFSDKDIYFIPTSGYTGDNLKNPIQSKNAQWYKGPVLLDLIDSLPAPIRSIDGPVRFIVNDVTKNAVNGLQGLNLYGKLDSGIISTNKEYIILPFGKKEKIKTIAVNKTKVDFITPGQHAELLLNVNKNSKEETLFIPGNIICSEKFPIPCVKKFKAHIKTYVLKTPIGIGQKMMFYLQEQKKQVTIKKIERIFNEGSKVSRNNTRFIPSNFYADVIIHSDDDICAELFKLNKKLATFALRINGDTQAMGYITEFIE